MFEQSRRCCVISVLGIDVCSCLGRWLHVVKMMCCTFFHHPVFLKRTTTIHFLLDILCVALDIGKWSSKMDRLEKGSGLSLQKVCDRLSLLLLLMCFTRIAR